MTIFSYFLYIICYTMYLNLMFVYLTYMAILHIWKTYVYLTEVQNWAVMLTTLPPRRNLCRIWANSRINNLTLSHFMIVCNWLSQILSHMKIVLGLWEEKSGQMAIWPWKEEEFWAGFIFTIILHITIGIARPGQAEAVVCSEFQMP